MGPGRGPVQSDQGSALSNPENLLDGADSRPNPIGDFTSSAAAPAEGFADNIAKPSASSLSAPADSSASRPTDDEILAQENLIRRAVGKLTHCKHVCVSRMLSWLLALLCMQSRSACKFRSRCNQQVVWFVYLSPS